MVADIPGIITYANRGDDRLRGLGVAWAKFALRHRLLSSSLHHCRIKVQVRVYDLIMRICGLA